MKLVTVIYAIACSVTHQLLTRSLDHSLAHTFAHSFAHSRTRSLAHSLTRSLTHSLTQSLTHWSMCRVDPFAADSPLKQTSVDDFPPDLFFVLRVVQLIRQATPVLLLQFMLQASAPACIYTSLPLEFFFVLRVVQLIRQAMHTLTFPNTVQVSVPACFCTQFSSCPLPCVESDATHQANHTYFYFLMFMLQLSVPAC